MIIITMPELWTVYSLMEELDHWNIRFLTLYGGETRPDYSLQDSERLMIVQMSTPKVELHILFPTPLFIPHWLGHIKDKYNATDDNFS